MNHAHSDAEKTNQAGQTNQAKSQVKSKAPILELQPLGPLLLRDGRPFSAGGEESRAQSLALPLPSTLAGFVRTQWGNQTKLDWKNTDDKRLFEQLKHLHSWPVYSQLVRYEDGQETKPTFLFPAPLNAVIDKEGEIYRSAPYEFAEGEGVSKISVSDGLDGKADDLRPLMLHRCLGPQDSGPKEVEDFKPDGGYVYWTMAQMARWLSGKKPCKDSDTLQKISGPAREERTHVEIDSSSGAGKEGALFTVNYSSFESFEKPSEEKEERGKHYRYALQVQFGRNDDLQHSVGHLGGERRPVALAQVTQTAQAARANWGLAWFDAGALDAGGLYETLRTELCKSDSNSDSNDKKPRRLCFVLTTPALFEHGWLPAWLSSEVANLGTSETGEQEKDQKTYQPPCGVSVLGRHKVKLVGAAVGRRIPVSGWRIRENKPKAVRWAVPAGSVYFLEVSEPLTDDEFKKFTRAFLQPLSDEQNDRRDGFGCALWGVWSA